MARKNEVLVHTMGALACFAVIGVTGWTAYAAITG